MSLPGVTDCPSTRFVNEPPSTLTSTSKYCVLDLLFVILSCGVAKPLEHAVRVALNVGENGSYALGPQEAPSELFVKKELPFWVTL